MLTQEQQIRLSIQRTLLDKTTYNLRRLSYTFEDALINLYFFYDASPSDEESELAGDISAEVIADFAEPWRIECSSKVIKFPEKIQSLGHIVYSRFE